MVSISSCPKRWSSPEYKETDWVKNGERVIIRRFPSRKPGSGIRYRLRQKQRYLAAVYLLKTFVIFKINIIAIIGWVEWQISLLLSCFLPKGESIWPCLKYLNIYIYNPYSISPKLVYLFSKIESLPFISGNPVIWAAVAPRKPPPPVNLRRLKSERPELAGCRGRCRVFCFVLFFMTIIIISERERVYWIFAFW